MQFEQKTTPMNIRDLQANARQSQSDCLFIYLPICRADFATNAGNAVFLKVSDVPSTKFGQTLANLGRRRPMLDLFDQFWLVSAKFGLNPTNVGLCSADSDLCSTRTRPNLG